MGLSHAAVFVSLERNQTLWLHVLDMKILFFQHVPREHPALFRTLADEQGIDLTVIELWKPYTIPAAKGFDRLIIMGGPMGVYEDETKYPSKNDELAFIKNTIGTMPMLGVCLGSQLIAHALGARVYPNEKDGVRLKEIGYYDIQLTDDGARDPLFAGLPHKTKVLQWHGDTFDLPQGAELLARSPDCENQAFHFQNAYGLQFHVEFTAPMVEKQIEVDREWLHEHCGDECKIDEDSLKHQAVQYADMMRQQCEKIFNNFISL